MRQVTINSIRRSSAAKIAVKTVQHQIVAEHIHDALELAYVMEGSAEQCLQGTTFHVKKGDYFIIDYHCAHSYRGSADFQVLNCMFLPELIEDSLVGCTSFDQLLRVCLGRYHRQQLVSTPANRIFSDTDGQILCLLEGIRQEASQNELGSREILRGKLLEILILTTRKVIQSLAVHHNAVVSQAVSQAIDYLAAHYTQKAVLQQFCQAFHYSVPYISSRFKAELGCTAVQYLQRIRIEKSCKLLASKQYSIQEVAEYVGYENMKFFQKVFSRLIGMSPREYRRRIWQGT